MTIFKGTTMTETMRINLDRTLTSIKIISAIAGFILAGFFVYTNIDGRIDAVESEQKVFKGIVDERTRSMATRIDDIYNIIIRWEVDKRATLKAQAQRSRL